MPGDAKLELKIKRIERYYAKSYVDEEEAMNLLCSNFSQNSEVIYSLDRTNWEYGKMILMRLCYTVGFSSYGYDKFKVLNNKDRSQSSFNDRNVY